MKCQEYVHSKECIDLYFKDIFGQSSWANEHEFRRKILELEPDEDSDYNGDSNEGE